MCSKELHKPIIVNQIKIFRNELVFVCHALVDQEMKFVHMERIVARPDTETNKMRLPFVSFRSSQDN